MTKKINESDLNKIDSINPKPGDKFLELSPGERIAVIKELRAGYDRLQKHFGAKGKGAQ